MNRRAIIITAAALSIATAMVLASAIRAAAAASARQAARDRLTQIAADAATVATLRNRQARISVDVRPAEDVIALVNAALADAGLPAGRLGDLRNESDVALPGVGDSGSQYRSQSLSLALREITIADLGAFLIAWRKVQSVWSITRLSLVHPRGRDESRDTFDASIVITAIYLAE